MDQDHDKIIERRIELGDGLVRVLLPCRTYNLGQLKTKLYELGYKIILVNGNRFSRSRGRTKGRRVSLACSTDLNLNLPTLLRRNGIPPYGNEMFIDIHPSNEGQAIEVLRSFLRENQEQHEG